MKVVSTICIALLTSVSLYGSSNKVILETYTKSTLERITKKEFDKINYYSKYEKLREFSKEKGLIIKVRPSGKFNILVIEPVKDEAVLKELMNIVKLDFQGAFYNVYKGEQKSRLSANENIIYNGFEIAAKENERAKKIELAKKEIQKPHKKPAPEPKKIVKTAVQKSEYDIAKELFNAKEYAQAYSIFTKLFLKDLSNPNINFYLGRTAYKLKKYEEALAAYERIIIVDDKAYRAKLEMALCYQQLGLPKEAKRMLLEVRSDVPENVQANIDVYLSAIEAKRKKHTFNGAAIVGVNYDTNIYGVTVDDVLSDKISNYTLNNTATDAFAHQEVVAANYAYATADDMKYKADFVLFNKSVMDYHEMDINLIQITPAISIMHSKKMIVDYALFLNKVWVGSNPMMINFGIYPKVKYIYAQNLILDGALKYQLQQNSTPNENRDNTTYSLELGAQHMYSKELTLGVKTKFDFVREKKSGEAADLNEVAYNLYELALNANYKYSQKIMIAPKIKAYTKSYIDPSISPLSGAELYKASDSEYQILLSGTYIYSPGLLLTLEYGHSIHNSNYVDNEFVKDTLSANAIIPF